MRLPKRRSPVTARPCAPEIGGSKERSTKGLASLTRSRVEPRTRDSSASTYTVMSGSSGTLVRHSTLRVVEVRRSVGCELDAEQVRVTCDPHVASSEGVERIYH